MSAMARLLSVNVGRPQPVGLRRGKTVKSAIGKAPVDGRVRVEGVNIAGDDQADRRVHGGPDKAISAYAREDPAWWERARGGELGPARCGATPPAAASAGRGRRVGWWGGRVGREPQGGGRRRAGGADRRGLGARRGGAGGLPAGLSVLQAGPALRRPQMLKRFTRAERPGAYLRIVGEGEIGA